MTDVLIVRTAILVIAIEVAAMLLVLVSRKIWPKNGRK